MMESQDYRVYPYRWVVLLAFMFINLTIQMLWISFASITGPAAAYYGVTDQQIGLLSMIFMIVYIPLSIPASWVIDTFGIRIGVGIGAVLLGVFGLLRGIYASDYLMVLIFTVGIAMGQPFLLNAQTKVAACWFAISERATAAGLATVANFIGTGIGLAVTPFLLENYSLNLIQLIYGAVAALSALLFLVLVRERPPTPPCPAGHDQRALMLDGLKQMLRQGDFWKMIFVFFVGLGIFNGIATWIESIVRPRGFTVTQAGLLGGLLLAGGIAGAIVLPSLSDYFLKRKPFLLLGMICAVPGLIGITFAPSYGLMIVSVLVLGFFMMGLGPIGYQYAAELTYPAPEGTSNGLLVLAGQISVVFVYAMEAFKSADGSFTVPLVALTVLMVVCCILIATLEESDYLKGVAEQRMMAGTAKVSS